MALPSSAWVPTTMSIEPSAIPFLTAASSLPVTSRDACPILIGKPRKRSVKVLVCWRAKSVVGTTTATCLPFMAATKAARSATSVLPKPTSPQISRSIGRPDAELVHGGVDRRLLVLGLLVGEAGAELVIGARLSGQLRRLAGLPLGRDLDQFVGDLADAALHPRLARLPGAAAEAVEIDVGVFRAVARQQLGVLDRQEQLVAAGVVDFEAVVRRAGGFDGAQPDEPPDAVVDMHDQVAGGEARRLRDEILQAAGAARRGRTRRSPRMSCSPTTAAPAVSNPLSRPSTAKPTCGNGRPCASCQDATFVRLLSPCSASTWLMRSRAPSLQSATTTRLRADCNAKTCLVTASNTLRPGSARSAAKLCPCLVPASTTRP